MDAVYLICLIVGGFFVALSIFGGGDHDGGGDADAGGDMALDAHVDVDAADASGDLELTAHEIGAGPGLVDLFSLRTIFLFAAFFGLTGVLLEWVGTEEPFRFLMSLGMGIITGLGGTYVIKRIGYQNVSSDITADDLIGKTARVTIPIEGEGKGKVSLNAKDTHMHLIAQAFDDESRFAVGDEVVVVSMEGHTAKVIKPD